jgi:hypothetical protein
MMARKSRVAVMMSPRNYEPYARQYGIGASLIAGPAIGAMSALAIRAYCHVVIKLSDTLPNFAPGKEVTCNVHGVRSEFLEGVDLNVLASSSMGAGSNQDQQQHDAKNDDNNADEAPSPVYFIGELVWTKGFDLMKIMGSTFILIFTVAVPTRRRLPGRSMDEVTRRRRDDRPLLLLPQTRMPFLTLLLPIRKI